MLIHKDYKDYKHLLGSSIRFLDFSTGTWTTVFLRFASSWVSNQKSPVVLEEGF